MKVGLVDRFDAFLELRQPWNELSSQTPDDHAFMRHEWFEHWLSSQEMTGNLHMITGWQDGQLVSVLPLVWKDVSLRRIRFRALRFAESPVSPRCNALNLTGQALDPLIEHLASERDHQLIELQHLEADSPTTRMLMDTLRFRSPLLTAVTPGRQSPYLILDCSWDEYLQGLSSNRRHSIRRTIKNLETREHAVEIRRFSDEAEADLLIESMIRVSLRTWKAGEGTAISQVPSQERLYKGFTKVGLKTGLVEAWILFVDRRPIACDYFLKCGDRYTGIRSDFDEAFREYRPGEYLHLSLIRQLSQSGRRTEVDLGGTVADYKLRWAKSIRHHLVVHAARPLSKGAVVVLWKKTRRVPRQP